MQQNMIDEQAIDGATLTTRREALRDIANRVTNLSGTALAARVIASAPWTLINSSTPNRTKIAIEPPSIVEYATTRAKRIKYGIHSPIDDERYIKILKLLKPQQYPLSCEIASLSHLLRVYGRRKSEKEIIDCIPKSTDPYQGVHPNLEIASRLPNPQDQIPPEVYGVFAKPMATSFNQDFANQLGLEAFYNDQEYTDIQSFRAHIAQLLAGNNFPIVWFVTCRDIADAHHRDGKSYPPYEHTGLITGLSSTGYLEYIDPYNATPYYCEIEEMYNRNKVCESNLLWLGARGDEGNI